MITTNAGREFHDHHFGEGSCTAGDRCPMAQAIHAIEAEARAEGYAAGLAAARKAVGELTVLTSEAYYLKLGGSLVELLRKVDVEDAIDALTPEDPA